MHWPLAVWRGSLSIAVGVLVGAGAAVVGIVAALPDSAPHRPVRAPVAIVAPPPAESPARVVDVSRTALERVGALDTLVTLAGIDAAHPVVSIDGAPVTDGLRDLATAYDVTPPGGYVDIGMGGDTPRRVVVLVHP